MTAQYTRARMHGLIPPLAADAKCVDCGAGAQCYDHRDYHKPLQVEPVCRPCNVRRGVGAPFNSFLAEAMEARELQRAIEAKRDRLRAGDSEGRAA
jgi:hypothetical protein